MRKLVCIFPEDESTNFLLPIYTQLEKLSGFIGYRFNTLDLQKRNSLYDALNQLEEDSFLVFLGHGASNKLYGSINDNGDKQVLFDKDNTKQLRNIDFLCIACRSKEFARNHFQNYIGFGDITSDFSEILAERDMGDPNYMKWANIDDIINFQNVFVETITKAILLTSCNDLFSIYNMMRLCFNKQIADLLKKKSLTNYRNIADMLFEVLNDLTYCSTNKL
jgi:hypothetical protein